jgi:hypothetical protein
LSATQGGGTAAIVVSKHKGPSANFLLFSAFPRVREGERDADADADAGAGLSWAEQHRSRRTKQTVQQRNHKAITLVFFNSGGNLDSCVELDL